MADFSYSAVDVANGNAAQAIITREDVEGWDDYLEMVYQDN